MKEEKLIPLHGAGLQTRDLLTPAFPMPIPKH